jgi:2'-5' RNA ligase
MRLFVALDLEEMIRQKIVLYLRGLESFAPDVRWAAPDSLHVTLKFIGERPAEDVPRIEDALGAIQAAPIALALRGYGFFPTIKAARVFWLAIEASADLPALAASVDTVLATLSIPREEHAFTPHLTLARGGSGSPRLRREEKSTSRFQRLQQRLSALPLPDFGTMTAREFFLYESKLSPGGSRYTKLKSFALQAS